MIHSGNVVKVAKLSARVQEGGRRIASEGRGPLRGEPGQHFGV